MPDPPAPCGWNEMLSPQELHTGPAFPAAQAGPGMTGRVEMTPSNDNLTKQACPKNLLHKGWTGCAPKFKGLGSSSLDFWASMALSHITYIYIYICVCYTYIYIHIYVGGTFTPLPPGVLRLSHLTGTGLQSIVWTNSWGIFSNLQTEGIMASKLISIFLHSYPSPFDSLPKCVWELAEGSWGQEVG